MNFLTFMWAIVSWSFHGAAVKRANPGDEWSGADLSGVARGGLLNEDVMQQIWDISNIPLPFTDRCGADSIGNALTTWTQDRLADPDLTNAEIDGVDNVKNNAKGGKRVGNHCQISTKAVSVTTRARASDSIGRSDELSYQVSERQKELRRDREAICLNNQASVADNGDTVAGKLGGLPSWIETNISTAGTAGGYDTGTGLTVAHIPGVAAALSETTLRDLIQNIYEQGGNGALVGMSTPACIRKISEYMFTSTARVATLQSDQGKSGEKATALGAVNYFVTDFGTLELTPNRLQQEVAADTAELHLLDFSLLRIATLSGYKTEPLAKTGLADQRQMSVDGTLKVLNEEGLGGYYDIDTSAAMVA
jgi:hypothetical protein